MLPTMFPMGSGTTTSTSTEPEHIDIEPCSSGPASGRTETSRQRCKRASLTLSKTTRYPDVDLTPALHIEPRDYQQAALDAWIDHDRRGSVILPTGSGKTFLGLQAIADASVSTLVVTPTTGLTNQWHATLTNAFGDQFSEPIGVSRLTSTNRQYSAIISSRISITETHRRSPLSICCVSNHHSL